MLEPAWFPQCLMRPSHDARQRFEHGPQARPRPKLGDDAYNSGLHLYFLDAGCGCDNGDSSARVPSEYALAPRSSYVGRTYLGVRWSIPLEAAPILIPSVNQPDSLAVNWLPVSQSE